MTSHFSLPYPPSVNQYWRRSLKYGKNGTKIPSMRISPEGRVYRVEVSLLIKVKGPMVGPLAVTIRVYPPDYRKRDLDNILKSLLDALQHAGVYQDDYQINELHITREHNVEGGAVEVEITEQTEIP